MYIFRGLGRRLFSVLSDPHGDSSLKEVERQLIYSQTESMSTERENSKVGPSQVNVSPEQL